MLEFKADAKSLQLLFERHPNTPNYVRTDERKLRQVLINLLNNALKFTTEGGVTLRVKADAANDKLLLFEIADTGAGIAPEELNTLFDAFTQTETGRQSEEGTGLGLPILSAGCNDFVRKPFREEILFDKMAQYLQVNYIYDRNGDSSAIDLALNSDFLLNSTSLEVMPKEWLTQLEQAASELDEDAIAKLINQIPEEHTLLTQTLQNKVDDFDFDEIVNLIQQTIHS